MGHRNTHLSMPRATRRRRTSVHATDSTHMPAPEARAGHQSQQRRSHVRKVTLRLPQINPSSLNPHSATPVLLPAPLEVHGHPLQHSPPPPQHLHASHLATGYPVPVGSQHDVHVPAMNVPPSHTHPYMPFYPPAFPQLQYPPSHIPPYGASIGAAHHQYAPSTPFLSQQPAMQYVNTADIPLPGREVQPRAGGSAREGALAHVDVREADEGRTYVNKLVSIGGKFYVLLRKEWSC